MKRKNLFSTLWTVIAIAALVTFAIPTHAFAGATPAGTAITNQATANFNDANGNAREAVLSALLTVNVAYKVVIEKQADDALLETVDGITVYKYFTIKNSGNHADNYTLTVQTPPTDWTVNVYHDNATVGTYEPLTDLAAPSTGAIAADETQAYVMVIVIPHSDVTAEDGKTYTPQVTITQTQAAVPGSFAVVNAGALSEQIYRAPLKIKKPIITVRVTNTAALASATNQIPGTTVTYTLEIKNTGSGAPSADATLTLPINANTGNATSSDADGAVSGGNFVWTLTPTALGASTTLSRSVTVTIDQTTNNGTGVAAGTPINIAGSAIVLSYNDGRTVYPISSSTAANFGVDRATGVLLTAYNDSPNFEQQSVDPGSASTATYYFKFKNTGNSSDSITFVNTPVATVGTITPTYTYALSTTRTGSYTAASPFVALGVPAGNEMWIKITASVAAGASDAAYQTFTFTGTSNGFGEVPNGSAKSSNAAGYKITVTAPNLVVTLAREIVNGPAGFVDDVTNVMPGTVLRYTVLIHNTGSGNAASVSVSNAGFAHDSGNNNVFNSGTIQINAVSATAEAFGTPISVPGTDSYNSDGITASQAAGIVTVGFSSIPASEYRAYRYNVTVQ